MRCAGASPAARRRPRRGPTRGSRPRVRDRTPARPRSTPTGGEPPPVARPAPLRDVVADGAVRRPGGRGRWSAITRWASRGSPGMGELAEPGPSRPGSRGRRGRRRGSRRPRWPRCRRPSRPCAPRGRLRRGEEALVHPPRGGDGLPVVGDEGRTSPAVTSDGRGPVDRERGRPRAPSGRPPSPQLAAASASTNPSKPSHAVPRRRIAPDRVRARSAVPAAAPSGRAGQPLAPRGPG